ncbi:MAG: hypothetical protein ABTD50_23780 [Polyangiaceae bacterium]
MPSIADAGAPNTEPPTDAELERGILAAVMAGMGDVARTLAMQLEDRRKARMPSNVVALRRPGER